MNTEIWADIKGFENRYMVSNFGRVKSLLKHTIRRQVVNHNGYNTITLSPLVGEKCCFRVHRLVAECFIPNPDNKPEVNHKDGNKLNNHISNLEWCTTSENMKHSYATTGRKSNLISYNKGLTKPENLWRERYQQAHEIDFAKKYPTAYGIGEYFKPKYPLVHTSNGLTNAICNYIDWIGGIGNRINVGGRLVEGSEKTMSGALISKKKWIKASTKKGTADIIATLPNAKTWHIEIKTGSDRPRPEQIKMQQRMIKAGVPYDFVSSMPQFFLLLDGYLSKELF